MPASKDIDKIIPYGRQSVSEEDIAAVVDTLRSDWLTQGPQIEQFELALTNYTGAKYCSVCCNGTAALHLGMLALGVGKGDLVWTVPNTFVATANAALYCGAKVDFVDINLDTINMDLDLLEEKLTLARSKNQLPKLVVPVHFAGNPVDMVRLWRLKKEFGFLILEDACHALGSSFENEPIGSCKYSDAVVFSFHPVKSITCGEGGAVLTNNFSIDNNVKLLRQHGLQKDPSKFLQPAKDKGLWFYEQQMLGFNYRMSSIHAALGVSQLKRLDRFIEKRNEVASRYRVMFEREGIKLQKISHNSRSACHLFVILCENEVIRERVFEHLYKHGIKAQVHYIPLHLQPVYKKTGFSNFQYLASEIYYAQCLSLPVYFGIQFEQVDFVGKIVIDAITKS